MNLFKYYPYLFVIIFLSACSKPTHDRVVIKSPNGLFEFDLYLSNSHPVYKARFDGKDIINESNLELKFSEESLNWDSVSILKVSTASIDSSWAPVYGEKREYPEKYNESKVTFKPLKGESNPISITVRAYNEGLAFRYEIDNNNGKIISSENTEFSMPTGTSAWVSGSAQGLINKMPIQSIKNVVERPILTQLNDSLFVAIGEAALVNYARTKFKLDTEKTNTLVTQIEGEVSIKDDFKSPWRTIMAGHTAGEILEQNYLLLNLNEGNKIEEISWIKPGKVIREVTLTTQGGLACVDFAVKHNLQYVEFDAGWYGNEYDDNSDATTITVDPNRSKGPLDLHKVIEYADSKGIGIILYVNRRSLEKQLDEVLPLLKSWGIKGVKYGFVNVGSQEWTSWLHEAVRKAAKYELMVDIHDEYRPTGYSRTYPNLLTQEGIRGDEASPDNTMVLKTVFVRMLAGAGDQTNCYFADRVDESLGSHASQLAKVICIYSPWQFLYWYDRPLGSPANVGGAGANTKFIKEVPELTFFDQVPTVWDDTRIIDGYPGEYAVIARKSGSTWFVGALNGLDERDVEIPLSFLESNKEYEATLFVDNAKINTETKVEIVKYTTNSKEILKRKIGANQGFALILRTLD